MFNKNQNKKSVSTKIENNISPAVNIISEGTKIKGNLNAVADLRIGGAIVGDTLSKERIIITKTGLIEGNALCENADIAGKVEGDIRVKNKLILRQSAVIDGNIFTKTLLVEEGAQINGNCKMGTNIELVASTDEKFAKESVVKNVND